MSATGISYEEWFRDFGEAPIDATIRLAEWLEYRQLTQAELAMRMNVSRVVIHQMVSGQRAVSRRRLADLAKGLGCSVDALTRMPR